jgi:hypothetical protein
VLISEQLPSPLGRKGSSRVELPFSIFESVTETNDRRFRPIFRTNWNRNNRTALEQRPERDALGEAAFLITDIVASKVANTPDAQRAGCKRGKGELTTPLSSRTGNLFDSQYFEGLAQINRASPSSEADQRLTEATFAEWSNLAD